MLWRRKNTQAIFPRIYCRSPNLNYTDHQIGTCIWGAPIPLWLKELVVIFFKTSQQTGQQLFWLRVVFYGRIWKDGRSVSADKARIISNLLGYFRMIWKALESKDGAEGGTRTPTSESPLPPQDSVSTSSTTSANPIEYATSLSLASLFCKLTRRVQLLHVPH